MKIVFLDFDGVLNQGSGPGLPLLVANLDRILTRTGAVIVVHSSWRWARSVETLRQVLRGWGVRGTVLDKCPSPLKFEQTAAGLYVPDDSWDEFSKGFDHNDERAIAIQRWLDEHPEVTRFVILDDSSHMGHFKGTPAFIRTRMNVGLTREQADQAIRYLGYR